MMHARRRGLPTLLGLALTTGVVAVATPARADDPEPVNTAPTAGYALDSTAIWSGQLVRLTESGLADDTTPPAAITRTITWGDGAVETAAAGTTTFAHTYSTVGSYAVSVKLNDGTLDGEGTFSTGATVGVATSPGAYAWQKSPIYTYPGYQERGTMVASSLPASTSAWTGWGDGETTLLRTGTSATAGHWYPTGTWTPQVTLQNGQGKATPRSAPGLSVRPDVTPPSISLTVPANPNAKASWSTIRGSASDSEAGVDLVGVQLWAYNSTADYFYNFASHSWVKYTGQTVPDSVQGETHTDAAGNWTMTGALGPDKGYVLEVYYYAWDQAGNLNDDYKSTYAITS